jgi:hypothetical protein
MNKKDKAKLKKLQDHIKLLQKEEALKAELKLLKSLRKKSYAPQTPPLAVRLPMDEKLDFLELVKKKKTTTSSLIRKLILKELKRRYKA